MASLKKELPSLRNYNKNASHLKPSSIGHMPALN